jgi:two-component system sensor histidine kinase RstB
VVAELASSFNAMAARIEALFRQREEMLQALAHEISTPLARMRFQLEAVESAPDGAARSAVLAALDRELTLLDGFSAELASWIDADGRRPERGPVDLSVVLSEIADQESLGRATPEIVVDCDPSAGLIVRADARQLQRATENVVRNALRYARERVVLRARAAPDGVRVEIADDGPGIPAQERARVLEPFARLEPSRSRSHGGMGLGLAIAQRVVTAHGGSLRIETAAEGGAAIVFHWPR